MPPPLPASSSPCSHSGGTDRQLLPEVFHLGAYNSWTSRIKQLRHHYAPCTARYVCCQASHVVKAEGRCSLPAQLPCPPHHHRCRRPCTGKACMMRCAVAVCMHVCPTCSAQVLTSHVQTEPRARPCCALLKLLLRCTRCQNMHRHNMTQLCCGALLCVHHAVRTSLMCTAGVKRQAASLPPAPTQQQPHPGHGKHTQLPWRSCVGSYDLATPCSTYLARCWPPALARFADWAAACVVRRRLPQGLRVDGLPSGCCTAHFPVAPSGRPHKQDGLPAGCAARFPFAGLRVPAWTG